MSLAKKSEKVIDETMEPEEEEITIPIKRKRSDSEHIAELVPPSILGWRIQCPHCGDPFIVKYNQDGTYELHIED